MQIHKILQYNFWELTKMLIYRCIYKFLISIRKYKNRYFYRNYKVILNFKTEIPSALLMTYKKYTICQDRVIKNANIIIEGNVFLFEKWNRFDYTKDWLKDPVLGQEWDRNLYANDAPFKKNGFADVKYVLEPNKLNPLVSVAQAFYITKDEKYIKFLEYALDGWTKCVPVERSVVNRIVMDIAYRAINLIHISVLCWDSNTFQKRILPRVLGILMHHEDYMWNRLSSRWFKSNNDNNHNVGEIVGLYITQVWLNYLLGIQYNKRQKTEVLYLIHVLDKIIAKSGAYIEQSGNYTKVVAEFIMLFEVFNKAFKIETKEVQLYNCKDYIERLGNYMKCISYNNILDNFGDNDGAMALIPFEKNTYSFEHIMKYIGDVSLKNDFTDASQCVYNSTDRNFVHVFTRVGRFAYYVEGAYIHAHNDILSILLSVKGSNLFIDKGCLYYNSGIDVRKGYVCLASHNNVAIDDLDSSELMTTGNRSYPSSELLEFVQSSNSLYLKGTLNYKFISQIRTIEYKDNQIIICDHIETSDDNTHCASISYLLGASIEAKMDYNKVLLIDTNNGNKFIVSFNVLDNIEIADDCFFPTYGLALDTKRLSAKKMFKKSIQLTTKIQIC